MNTAEKPTSAATTAAVTDIAGIIEKCDNVTEVQSEICYYFIKGGGNMKQYICTVCGYIHETEGELPDDFKCPICGAGKDIYLIDLLEFIAYDRVLGSIPADTAWVANV